MANKTQTIRIESVLGGHSKLTHFSNPNEYRASLGIDPSSSITSSPSDPYGIQSSGLIVPTSNAVISKEVITDPPMWIASNPKNDSTYIYGYYGSVYSSGRTTPTVITGLSDLNDGGSSRGNGMAYYDNYMYFARDTTIARYGPLNGTPSFTDDYWVGVLGKTALDSSTFFEDVSLDLSYPNHVMLRHSDGALYIADRVNDQAVLHKLATTKTTVEGDTDNGSTYNILSMGYGLCVTALESYNGNIAIGLGEKRNSGSALSGDSYNKAKIAFWDAVSSKINQILWPNFPDGLISSLKNTNGRLNIISGPVQHRGFRVSVYLGGDSIEEIFYSESGIAPFPGAVAGDSNRLLLGSNTYIPETAGCVWSLNTKRADIRGLFNITRATSSSSATLVTALNMSRTAPLQSNDPQYVGWSTAEGIGAGYHGIDYPSSGDFTEAPPVWWSQVFRIGKRFKITKLQIPLGKVISYDDTIVTPKIYTDDGTGTIYTGSSDGLPTINSTNYAGKRLITMRPKNLTGESNFWLELRWSGTALCAVGLPITIEYELLDD